MPKIEYTENNVIRTLSSNIGAALFGAGAVGRRKEDEERINAIITEVLTEYKENTPDFDLDYLLYDAIQLQTLQESLTAICKEHCQKTYVGILTGGIYFPESAKEQVKPLISKELDSKYKICSAKANDADAAQFDKFKKEKLKNDPLRLKAWEFGPQQQEPLHTAIGNLQLFIRKEVNEEGNEYDVYSPIIGPKELEAFARLKSPLSLNNWLKQNVPTLNGQQVIADISGDTGDDKYALGSHLKGINLDGSIIRNLIIANADCRDINFNNCDIKHLSIDIETCLFGGMSFLGADTDGVHFSRFGQESDLSAAEIKKDKKNPIHLDVVDLKKAKEHKIIQDSVYNEIIDSKQAYSLSPLYTRAKASVQRPEVVVATRKDVEEYLKLAKPRQSFNDFLGKGRNISADLSKVNFDDLDLSESDFSLTDLNSVDFTKASGLEKVIFFGACLQFSNFSGQNISGSSFEQAAMQGANLREAIATDCNFNDSNNQAADWTGIKGKLYAQRANLRFAKLDNVRVADSDFRKMRAEGITMANAHAERCIMIGADLTAATLKGAYLDGANLNKAILDKVAAQGASLKYAQLNKVSAEMANFEKAIMDEVQALGANFSKADMEGIMARHADFSKAKLTEANITSKADFTAACMDLAEAVGADFSNAVLTGIRARSINLAYAKLIGVKAQQVQLQHAILQHVEAQNIDLTGTDLKQANLEFANLLQARLDAADLEKANLKAANLNRASVNAANFQDVNIDANTNLMNIDLSQAKNVDQALLRQQAQQEWANQPLQRAGSVLWRIGAKIAEIGAKVWQCMKGIVKLLPAFLISCAIGVVIGAASLYLLPNFVTVALFASTIITATAITTGIIGTIASHPKESYQLGKDMWSVIKECNIFGTAIGAVLGALASLQYLPFLGHWGAGAGAVVGGVAGGITVGAVATVAQEEFNLLNSLPATEANSPAITAERNLMRQQELGGIESQINQNLAQNALASANTVNMPAVEVAQKMQSREDLFGSEVPNFLSKNRDVSTVFRTTS